MSSFDQLHYEAQMLKVREHSHLLSAQYLVKCLDYKNVCHNITTLDPPPCMMKHTLFGKIALKNISYFGFSSHVTFHPPEHILSNTTCRYYLGLGRYAPNTAVNGDMGWDIPEHRQWLSVTRKWCRIIRMSDTSLTKKFFLGYWAQSSPSCKTWFFKVTTFFAKYDDEQQCLSPEVSTSAVLNSIKPKLLAEYELEWQEKLLPNHMLKLLLQRNIVLHMQSLDVE